MVLLNFNWFFFCSISYKLQMLFFVVFYAQFNLCWYAYEMLITNASKGIRGCLFLWLFFLFFHCNVCNLIIVIHLVFKIYSATSTTDRILQMCLNFLISMHKFVAFERENKSKYACGVAVGLAWIYIDNNE